MRYRFVLFALCLLTFGGGQKLCPLHNARMTRKQVPIIFVEDRLNIDEWQSYTNARARLFPYSCDDLQTNVDNLPLDKSGEIDWQKIPTKAWIYVCPACEERKQKWQAEHPPRKREPGEVP